MRLALVVAPQVTLAGKADDVKKAKQAAPKPFLPSSLQSSSPPPALLCVRPVTVSMHSASSRVHFLDFTMGALMVNPNVARVSA